MLHAIIIIWNQSSPKLAVLFIYCNQLYHAVYSPLTRFDKFYFAQKHVQDECQHSTAATLNSYSQDVQELQEKYEELKLRHLKVENLVHHQSNVIRELEKLIFKLQYEQCHIKDEVCFYNFSSYIIYSRQ